MVPGTRDCSGYISVSTTSLLSIRMQCAESGTSESVVTSLSAMPGVQRTSLRAAHKLYTGIHPLCIRTPHEKRTPNFPLVVTRHEGVDPQRTGELTLRHAAPR
jgi:hypothetical protein